MYRTTSVLPMMSFTFNLDDKLQFANFCSLLARGGVAWTMADKASLAFEEALPDHDDDVDDDHDVEERSTDGSSYSETKSFQQQQMVDQV